MKHNLTVMDLFCGAGGFSQGFKQQGFNIVLGIDNWKPATDTFNYNFNLNCGRYDLSAYWWNLDLIENLPDTDVIIGSPPCTSFSNSNSGGNAEKSQGILLINKFLQIIAVKKHKPNSKLKAWVMENVVNSNKYLKTNYSFADLNLEEWAIKNNLNPTDCAINFNLKRVAINSVDFGVPQIRIRLFAGEVTETGVGLNPTPFTSKITVKDVIDKLPNPLEKEVISGNVTDPNYSKLTIPKHKLSDHFYDTRIYEVSWRDMENLKTNHPYMGRMPFPERFDTPSRTVVAANIIPARESLVYKSETNDVGDGEYRTPTVREAATLMSFPITYQFIAKSEQNKWKLVGNSVCPLVSNAFAKHILKSLKIDDYSDDSLICNGGISDFIPNLNTYEEKILNNPPIRRPGCRFRRHPFKGLNMTIALSNYDLILNGKSDGVWRASVTYGSGADHIVQGILTYEIDNCSRAILDFPGGKDFIEEIESKEFKDAVSGSIALQSLYEIGSSNEKLSPIDLILKINKIVSKYAGDEITNNVVGIFKFKDKTLKKHLYAFYAVSRLAKMIKEIDLHL